MAPVPLGEGSLYCLRNSFEFYAAQRGIELKILVLAVEVSLISRKMLQGFRLGGAFCKSVQAASSATHNQLAQNNSPQLLLEVGGSNADMFLPIPLERLPRSTI